MYFLVVKSLSYSDLIPDNIGTEVPILLGLRSFFFRDCLYVDYLDPFLWILVPKGSLIPTNKVHLFGRE